MTDKLPGAVFKRHYHCQLRCLCGVIGIIFLWQSSIRSSNAETLGQIVVSTKSDSHPKVAFDYWLNQRDGTAEQILLLVPGYNGSGPQMFNPQWKDFASKHHLVLFAPTFTTSPEEVKSHQGYYYPEQWSGEATEKALTELCQRETASPDKIMIFGFSAGAHFAHRFALWRPGRVKAFVAYSAAWWDDPTEKLANVPALIMCGESDPRYEATWQFMTKAQSLNLPWVWRSYQDTGHHITPIVQRMAEVFLAHYADAEPDTPLFGDVQTYKYFPSEKMDSIPPQERVVLPSKAIADQWTLENMQ